MPSPNAWAAALADPANTDPAAQQAAKRRKAVSMAQLLMQQAGDTSAPVYSRGQGMAKLAAGAIGGLVDGWEQRQERERQAALLAGGGTRLRPMSCAG